MERFCVRKKSGNNNNDNLYLGIVNANEIYFGWNKQKQLSNPFFNGLTNPFWWNND